MCVTVNIHPPMSKTRIPASVQSVNFNIPTTHLSYTYMSVSSKSGSKTLKSDQAKCHAPFSSREHVGSIMSNMSFHDVMSRHVVMSCHVVTLETDPCVCHCQYSPTHVKDQKPCLCWKCHFQPSHLSSDMSLSPKSGSKTPKSDQAKCHAPFSTRKHVCLIKVWLENAQNKPRPDPTFDPSRIRFLIVIEFDFTTPLPEMVLPVRAATQAGRLNYC